jgi:hypothetical protein
MIMAMWPTQGHIAMIIVPGRVPTWPGQRPSTLSSFAE